MENWYWVMTYWQLPISNPTFINLRSKIDTDWQCTDARNMRLLTLNLNKTWQTNLMVNPGTPTIEFIRGNTQSNYSVTTRTSSLEVKLLKTYWRVGERLIPSQNKPGKPALAISQDGIHNRIHLRHARTRQIPLVIIQPLSTWEVHI